MKTFPICSWCHLLHRAKRVLCVHIFWCEFGALGWVMVVVLYDTVYSNSLYIVYTFRKDRGDGSVRASDVCGCAPA